MLDSIRWGRENSHAEVVDDEVMQERVFFGRGYVLRISEISINNKWDL